MGLFGSSKVTTVGTQVQRVIEDDALPNSVREGFTKNLFETEYADQPVENILEQMSNSIAMRANRMFTYGQKSYMFGLPSSTIKSSLAGETASKAAIQTQVGGTVQLSYYHYGALNSLHLGWKKLVEEYGYVAGTNRVTGLEVAKGAEVFLADMQVIVTDATLEELDNGSLDIWGDAANSGVKPSMPFNVVDIGKVRTATVFAVDSAAQTDYVKVTVSWVKNTEKTTTVQTKRIIDGVEQMVDEVFTYTVPETFNESFNVPLTGFDTTQEYHQARYVKADGSVGYWVYKAGTGTYPAVDAVFDTEFSVNGSFFPFAYFRYEKKSTVANTSTEEFKHGKKLMKYLNMDYEELGKAINQNPDIADVEQAMMMMAVPANTSDPIEQRYLFDFFSNIQESTENFGNNNDYVQELNIIKGLNIRIPVTGIIIQDKRFKMALNYQGINRRKVKGNIGKVGSYSSGYGVVEHTTDVPQVGGGTKPWVNSTKSHWYRNQITESLYEEIQVTGLTMTYFIFGQYTTTGDETDEILMVPLDISIANQYTIPQREVLYSRALHYVFNSRVVTKLKWYQTGLFRAILIIIAIVVTVLSYGSTWQSIGAAVAAGTITISQLVVMILISALKYIVATVAVKLFVKAVGVKIAFIAAIVAAVMGMTLSINAGTVTPFATDMLTVSTNLSKGIQGSLKEDYADLLNQKSEFDQYVEEQTKTIETAEDLLNSNNLMNPLLIWGETPDELYQRTVHSGNIGMVGIDIISNYVDVSLQLPKISETIGETKYGTSSV